MRLAEITIESGVAARDGSAFCHVTATDPDGTEMHGQMTPGEVRAIALQWLEAAEAADQDAAVHALLVERFGLDTTIAGDMLIALRARRAEAER